MTESSTDSSAGNRGVDTTNGVIAGWTRQLQGPLRCEKTHEDETRLRILELLTESHLSYNIAVLRCVRALPLFASFIRDQNAASDTAR